MRITLTVELERLGEGQEATVTKIVCASSGNPGFYGQVIKAEMSVLVDQVLDALHAVTSTKPVNTL